jgi:hypothetical protein
MASGRRSRRRVTRYFVLSSTDHESEIARISSRGSSSYYEPETGSWVNDPLLGAEIRLNRDWRLATPDDLPDGIVVSSDEQDEPPPRRRGWFGVS